MNLSMRTASTRGVAILAATVAVVVTSVISASAEPTPPPGPTGPPIACPGGLPYKMTLEQALVHYEGYYTEEEIRAGFDGKDANDNGYVCYHLDPEQLTKFLPLVIYFPLDDFEG